MGDETTLAKIDIEWYETRDGHVIARHRETGLSVVGSWIEIRNSGRTTVEGVSRRMLLRAVEAHRHERARADAAEAKLAAVMRDLKSATLFEVGTVEVYPTEDRAVSHRWMVDAIGKPRETFATRDEALARARELAGADGADAAEKSAELYRAILEQIASMPGDDTWTAQQMRQLAKDAIAT